MAINTALTGKSAANLVEYGYGQLEPNHLSAQRTGQIYAQLPAVSTIDKLEQGQFVKYDYAKGVVDFAGEGEWMLVYNETKLYRDEQQDCEFAMLKGDYKARIYSPASDNGSDYQLRNYSDDVVPAGSNLGQLRELDYTDDPFHVITDSAPAKMPTTANSMVPRVYKTNVGDILTTNTVNLKSGTTFDALTLGTVLYVDKSTGILTDDSTKKNATDTMQWQVVKKYTVPDGQKGLKIMRIA